jgi:hypothetical protein
MADGRKSMSNRLMCLSLCFGLMIGADDRTTVNQARAMRISEIMNDFRNIQVRIAAINAQPSREEFNEDGYVLLRQSQAEAKALLSQPFEQVARGRGTEEHHKVQLKRYDIYWSQWSVGGCFLTLDQ